MLVEALPFHQVRSQCDPETVRRHADRYHRLGPLLAGNQVMSSQSELANDKELTSASNHMSISSSGISPIPSRHPRTTAAVQPSTRRTMLGRASLKLTINSRAAFRTSSVSSSSVPFAVPLPLTSDTGAGGGNVKLVDPGFGCATVGVGPESAEGSIRPGRNFSKAGRCGSKRDGFEDASGVKVARKLGRCA